MQASTKDMHKSHSSTEYNELALMITHHLNNIKKKYLNDPAVLNMCEYVLFAGQQTDDLVREYSILY